MWGGRHMKMGWAAAAGEDGSWCIEWVRLRLWELTVEKAKVEVAASIERGGCVVYKAAAAVGSESRGGCGRPTNHVQKATVYCCPMSVRLPLRAHLRLEGCLDPSAVDQ
eukprot:CAMPEP_0174695726 /NCGR_PEP_ID=MMETSP1094-20130205/2044_1 /TAXON_ID=156173 /ORGANISM="Chrysochromulina brevifilum, Strain UTEX LB 985" /LENGTH=108 /DNA_ID=CAMNT_0015892299 /DNA_START=614 /DNA_END=941 /DNA_ORIENTATION=+